MKKKKSKAGRKLLSMLLAAAMLVTAEGATVSAQPSVDAKGAESPSNPVHHCTKQNDGTDYTDWSYVYFGSYPQTEVSGEALTAVITVASYDANGDAWVNGMKYRRISASDTNNSEYFGDSAYRYFKWEPIRWRVLQNDGSTLFVVADKGLDCEDYNEEFTSVTWETCTLRNWLNNDFYGTAFSSEEQQAIVSQTVVNEDNPDYNTEGGNNTDDKIYLLSIGEVTDPAYGFCEEYSTYSASRRMQASDYAHVRGVWRSTSSEYEGNCWWWLRSPGYWLPGYNTDFAAEVNYGGNVLRYGDNVSSDIDTVVPALHINLSSELWSSVDDGSSGEGGNGDSDTTQNPDGSQNTTGNSDTQQPQNTAVNKISISVVSKKIAAGKKISLTAVVAPQDASDSRVTWTSSNKKYAAVNANGVVTTKKAGAGKSVTITATAADGSGVKASIKLKLMKHAVTKVSLAAPGKTIKAGSSMSLKAKVKTNGKQANKALQWTSSNPKYAAVSAKGKVTAKKAGKGKTVTITAMSTDGTNKKAKVKLKIK